MRLLVLLAATILASSSWSLAAEAAEKIVCVGDINRAFGPTLSNARLEVSLNEKDSQGRPVVKINEMIALLQNEPTLLEPTIYGSISQFHGILQGPTYFEDFGIVIRHYDDSQQSGNQGIITFSRASMVVTSKLSCEIQ